MHSHSCLYNISNFIFEQEQTQILADANPYEKPYNTVLQIHSCPTLIRYSATSSVSISGISLLPRLIQQFTRDIVSYLLKLLTFKECCPVVVIFEQITCGCLQGCTVSWLLFMSAHQSMYYSDSQYSSLLKRCSP